MVDWNKDVKLSDVFGRKKAATPGEPELGEVTAQDAAVEAEAGTKLPPAVVEPQVEPAEASLSGVTAPPPEHTPATVNETTPAASEAAPAPAAPASDHEHESPNEIEVAPAAFDHRAAIEHEPALSGEVETFELELEPLLPDAPTETVAEALFPRTAPPPDALPLLPPVEPGAEGAAELPPEPVAPEISRESVESLEPLASVPVTAPEPVAPRAVAMPPHIAAPPAPPPGIHPPVPASELDTPAAEKKSLLKREISFGRKPKAEKAPKERKQKADKPAGGKSLLKKELSFGRKSKTPETTEARADDDTLVAPKKSFLKGELSFGRKPKAGLTPDADGRTDAPKSFLRRDFSFGRKPKDANAPAGEKPQTTPKEKKPRKQLTLRKGAAPTAKRHKRLVGLKIGGSQLAAARIANNGSPVLLQLAREDLDQGVIVGGELREPELLADALKAFFQKHKLPKQGVRLGIANNRIGVRIFEIGGIDDPKQLENAIRYRAQEALPIPIEEAVLDYHVLEEKTDAEGAKTRRILLVVAYRDLIDRYVSACKRAGIKLAGIDLEAFALLRALGDPPAEGEPASDAALVVVSIGHDRSTFAVSDGRVCEFTRVLDWGGSTLDIALARALDMAPSEAEPVKRLLSLSFESTPEGLTAEQAAAGREAIRKQLQTFARELVSSLQFYQNQPGSLGIGEIVITGGTAHLEGLAEELQRLIGVTVRVGDPLSRVNLGKKVAEREQVGSLAVAIGLGIED